MTVANTNVPKLADHLAAAERPKTLAQVARELSMHPSAILRWGKDGILVAGVRHRMTMFRCGGRWMVYPSALADFLERLNAGRDSVLAARSKPSTSAARHNAVELAEAELARIGI